MKNPKRTLPLSILLALAISMVLYAVTGFVATGLQDFRLFAVSGSPLADAASKTGSLTLVGVVTFGALVATVSVLLTSLLGLSRVSFAMARNRQLPESLAKIHSRLGTPYVSILITGTLMSVLALVLDLKESAAITSFSILFTHVLMHFSAIRLRKKIPNVKTFKMPLYPLIPCLGIASCVVLMLSLPAESWIISAGAVAVSSLYYGLRRLRAK